MNYKVLNLYAGLGGNRYLWSDCQVTAVESDPELARMYQVRFPGDTVVVGDAHQYLLDNYKEFDFIWTSPPCPTHSQVRHIQKNTNSFVPKYPSMILYEEIIFLQNHFTGKYIVENVVPYYEPLIKAQKRNRHLYWCNFILPSILSERKAAKIGNVTNEVEKLCLFHQIDLSDYKGTQRKAQIARNCVDYEAGLTILNTARNIMSAKKDNQVSLFQL